jgi:hypothetical protein
VRLRGLGCIRIEFVRIVVTKIYILSIYIIIVYWFILSQITTDIWYCTDQFERWTYALPGTPDDQFTWRTEISFLGRQR